MRFTPSARLLCSAAVILVWSASGFAQTAPAGPAPAAEDPAAEDEELEAIIVTGTSAKRTGFDTPLSVSSLGADDLARASASSQADIMATIPGVKAEGGGGEVAANVQVRGLPSSGQFQFTPLNYDGVPAFSTFGLNSSAFDVYVRNDLGIERLEYVQGGVSNLFGPGSVAGIFNYVSKTGSSDFEGIAQAEWADKGRVRGDMFISGPINENTFYALSGFYRYDEGPLKSGLPTDGFQLRGNIKHEFADGGGEVRLFGQYIHDRVQFFLPIPLSGQTLERVAGSDGQTVNTLNTAQARNLVSILPGGLRYETPIEDGVETKGGTIGIIVDRDLGNGFQLNIKAKWSSYQHQFNLFLDGDGIINVPETQLQFLANRSITGAAAFTYADSGQAVAVGTLLFPNRVLNRDRPATDFSSEVNLIKELQTGAVTHNITLGAWFARAEADDNSVTQTYLAEFRNAPRLVNLTAGGVNYTRNGLLDPSVGYTQNEHSARRVAAFLANQMESDRWALDVGVRVEQLKGDLNRERTATFNGISQGGAVESAALTSAVFGTGSFLTGTVKRTEWAASIGGLYKLTDDLNVYANLSRGFFFPEIRSVAFNALGQPASYEGEIIQQAELGLKYSQSGLRASVALFWSKLSNRRSVQFQNLPGGGIGEVVLELSTRAYGVEVTGSYQITDALSVDGNVTYTDHKITDSGTASLIGRELERKPNWFANAGIVYDDGSFDANFSWNYQSTAFANNGNTATLPAYSLFRLGAGYKLNVADEQSVRVGVSVFNLFNSQGLAEGSPRVGANQTAGGQFFVGRPILPRRVSVTATYAF
jgi:iron complex outermembrane recepter protein